jgi:hypothetical protein
MDACCDLVTLQAALQHIEPDILGYVVAMVPESPLTRFGSRTWEGV